MVFLGNVNLARLNKEDTIRQKKPTLRIIVDDVVEEQGLQINKPFGEEG